MLDPLTIERMAHVSSDAPIVVALSGGGDSVALLRLMAARFGANNLRALIVDHALRDGSAGDAERAQAFAGDAGVSAEILTVSWPGGVKRNQAAARTARYEILCGRAREMGARVIAVAHTADDQIETVLMRAGAGSSWRGLAGMAAFAPAPVWPAGRNLWLARPLLAQRREHLRDYLQERGGVWIDDPANANAVFERVRVRGRLAALEASGADVMRLAQLAARIRPYVDRLDAEAAALIAQAAAFDGPAIFIDRAVWSAPDHVRRRALSALICGASGAAREPATDAIERLDDKMQSASFPGASLGGAIIVAEHTHFRLRRDPGALAGRGDGVLGVSPLPLEPHRTLVWDGRLELCVAEPGWCVTSAAEGAELSRCGEKCALAQLTPPDRAAWLLRQRVTHLLGQHI
ncbi:MAG TPA: tRNA lysidine(34) synthetase TilS [Vitreimonas sp.]|nr:tRNA lysidine(34) synthetase TilS [Vitreimonas sp.]